MVMVGADKQETGRAGKVQDENDDDHQQDPGLPKAMALMLAPTFLGLGLVLLWVGKTDGGFIGLVMSVMALVTGFINSCGGR